jgi:hypothetical protein
VTVVGVAPGAELTRRPRLFAALARAYEVEFSPRAPGEWLGLDAAVLFDGADAAPPPPVPRLTVADRGAPAAPAAVDLEEHAAVPASLRGARVDDGRAGAGALGASPGVALASSAGGTVWRHAVVEGLRADASTLAPEELGPEEPLRDRLRAGRFLALLPILELLRAVTGERAWAAPGRRAAIILDDPNLRRPSYGHLDYGAVVPHARRHGYHLAVAMIPLDAGWTHPAAVRAFRDGGDVLSLLVHGNDHLRGELARPGGGGEAAAVVGQALGRVASFERRTGLRVARVMAPPHEVWGESAASAMLAGGLEAMCADPGEAWLGALAGGDPLADWWPAARVAGGLPVVPRSLLSTPSADLRLRAYLGHPMVLYGHHWDLRGGLDRLEEAAAEVRRIGSYEWTSLERVARSCVETRTCEGVLEVRMHARRAEIEPPPGVGSVRVRLPPGTDGAAGEVVVWRTADRAGTAAVDHPIGLGDASALELRLVRQSPPGRPPSPGRLRLWPVARRSLTEGRDRLGAALGRWSG